MSDLFDGIDLSNPCLVWPKLQEAYYRLLAGEAEVRIEFDDKRKVELHRVNMELLKREIDTLRAACEAKTGGRRSRYAIRAGFLS